MFFCEKSVRQGSTFSRRRRCSGGSAEPMEENQTEAARILNVGYLCYSALYIHLVRTFPMRNAVVYTVLQNFF